MFLTFVLVLSLLHGSKRKVRFCVTEQGTMSFKVLAWRWGPFFTPLEPRGKSVSYRQPVRDGHDSLTLKYVRIGI